MWLFQVFLPCAAVSAVRDFSDINVSISCPLLNSCLPFSSPIVVVELLDRVIACALAEGVVSVGTNGRVPRPGSVSLALSRMRHCFCGPSLEFPLADIVCSRGLNFRKPDLRKTWRLRSFPSERALHTAHRHGSDEQQQAIVPQWGSALNWGEISREAPSPSRNFCGRGNIPIPDALLCQ